MKTASHYNSGLTVVKKNTRPISIGGIYSMFEAKRNSDFYFSGEYHSPWEMVYIIDGHAGVTADDRVYSLCAGDVIFHKPMEFHKIWSEEGCPSHVFICSFSLEGALSYKLRNGVFHLGKQPTAEIRSILALLRSHQHTQNHTLFIADYFEFLDESTLPLVISHLESLMLQLVVSDKKTLSADNSEKVRLYTEIVKILEQHVYDRITIAEIASLCNVSSATVKNYFADYAGCGVHKYFLKIKIRTAIELLREGKNVNEVSDLLQFANPNYFSYVFKRETGVCASTYKE